MSRSSQPGRKEFQGSGGRFIQGEYSPALRRVPASTASTAPLTTTIPPRASAHPSDVVKVRPRYPRAYSSTETLERDVTRIPTMPPTAAIWQYETPQYEAESSLSSLSLAISEATRLHSQTIDELDTSPPLPDHPTLARRNRNSKRPLIAGQEIDRTEIKTTPEFVGRQEAIDTSVSRPFDRFRWWLLAPGRIELILWICGTVLLICITGLLVFILAVSTGFVHSSSQQNDSNALCGPQQSARSATSGGANCTLSTISSSSGLRITMVNGDLMETGKVLQLRGQGFHHLGHIAITHDANLPCQPDMIQANGQGEFAVVIKLEEKRYWGAGMHQIKINDIESKHSIILNVMLAPQK